MYSSDKNSSYVKPTRVFFIEFAVCVMKKILQRHTKEHKKIKPIPGKKTVNFK